MENKQLKELEQIKLEVEKLENLKRDKQAFLNSIKWNIVTGKPLTESLMEQFRQSRDNLVKINNEPLFRNHSDLSVALRIDAINFIEENITPYLTRLSASKQLIELLEGAYEDGCADDSRCDDCEERMPDEPRRHEGYD